MNHGFSKEIVDQGEAILRQDGKAVGEIESEFVDFLLNVVHVGTHGILHCSEVIVHPKNRGGLMINAFESHQKGSKVKHVGAKLEKLVEAVCMQMSPDPVKRKDFQTPLTSTTSRFLGLEPDYTENSRLLYSLCKAG
jgi:hypothetical protein